ncbi:NAD(P)-dependent oxidoreductase [Streptomonospora nanhaiensis]|uniref:Putative NADH-flavin reductase n=1 Tax=Streptomonospora nanhaiensis TaxID=1323731 RepID=A0A853BFZ3_9ACTN|nr:SDR family oxidoreductase [Streptomonospora nanhaiensis]MBV2366420.1 SDR family oxidoreductase [Streptomonospora nanhaiensis]MBX9389963.1 SDR family oxidoreductase [Streptomonospora nanhaiensis]NYI94239.1 putative NADH-flavin reductase [Streptomonospora nanhaiensis]
MKFTLFGATGGVGAQFARQACEAGHGVTAVVRDPARMAYTHPDLAVTRADVMDPEAIGPLIAGRDAVVSALGHRGPGPATVCAQSARSITAAMAAYDVRRLVVVSAAGMFTDGDGPFTRFVVKPILQRVLRENFADMSAMEQIVQASSLDWTIVRPPQLLDRPRTGTYRTSLDTTVPRGMRVARADVADLMLRTLERGEPLRRAVFLAN